MSNVHPLIAAVEELSARKKPLPTFRPGDTVRVHALIREGNKERVQVFEGVCIHRKAGGRRRSFTVRKVSHGIGVERVFMEDSPKVVDVEVVTRGRVRRSKLYYLRGLRGKAARIRARMGDYAENLVVQPQPEPEPAAEAAEAAEAAGEADAAN